MFQLQNWQLEKVTPTCLPKLNLMLDVKLIDSQMRAATTRKLGLL